MINKIFKKFLLTCLISFSCFLCLTYGNLDRVKAFIGRESFPTINPSKDATEYYYEVWNPGFLGIGSHMVYYKIYAEKYMYAYDRLYLKNLSGTTYWDHNANSGIISITSTTTVSRSKSITISASLGYNFSEVVAGKIGYSETNSVTYTVENSVTHSRTMDRETPVGYYSLASSIDADLLRINKLSTLSKNDGYLNLVERGEQLAFRTKDPYVALRYTTSSH